MQNCIYKDTHKSSRNPSRHSCRLQKKHLCVKSSFVLWWQMSTMHLLSDLHILCTTWPIFVNWQPKLIKVVCIHKVTHLLPSLPPFCSNFSLSLQSRSLLKQQSTSLSYFPFKCADTFSHTGFAIRGGCRWMKAAGEVTALWKIQSGEINHKSSEKIKCDGDNLEVRETDVHVAEPVTVGLFGWAGDMSHIPSFHSLVIHPLSASA